MKQSENATRPIRRPPRWWYYTFPLAQGWLAVVVGIDASGIWALRPWVLGALQLVPTPFYLVFLIAFFRNMWAGGLAEVLNCRLTDFAPALKNTVGPFLLPKSISAERRWFIPVYYAAFALPFVALGTGIAARMICLMNASGG